MPPPPPVVHAPPASVTPLAPHCKQWPTVGMTELMSGKPLALLTAIPKAVAAPVPRPDTPVLIGRPVPFVKVADVGVPRIGVTNVGLVEAEIAPVPLRAEPKAVAMFAPSPLMPVDTGSPVALVSVPLAGIPRAGVTSVGEVAKTALPEPVVAIPSTTVALVH